MTKSFRVENDSIGSIEVPSPALWGAQTQRALMNFAIGNDKIPIKLIYSLSVSPHFMFYLKVSDILAYPSFLLNFFFS